MEMAIIDKFKDGINVLSLFDGMSCGQIALKELGIPVKNYFASEIDKHAIAQTKLNFPNTIHLGSVVDVDVSKLPKIDLILAGSPCQSFSFIGKMEGMKTTDDEKVCTLDDYLQQKAKGTKFKGQSYLFWEFIRILTEIRGGQNPNVKFLFENVVMAKEWEQVLSETIGLHPVKINSALVSAQNRKRLYWSNIKVRSEGLFGDLYTDIPQPKDRGILIADIIEKDVDPKYFLKDEVVAKLLEYNERNKAKGNGFRAKIHRGGEKMTVLKVGGKGVDDLVYT